MNNGYLSQRRARHSADVQRWRALVEALINEGTVLEKIELDDGRTVVLAREHGGAPVTAALLDYVAAAKIESWTDLMFRLQPPGGE